MRSSKEAMVLGSLDIAVLSSLWVMSSGLDSVRQRRTVNWSGVTPVLAMRRRNALFRPYQAPRRRGGNRRRSGESIGKTACFSGRGGMR